MGGIFGGGAPSPPKPKPPPPPPDPDNSAALEAEARKRKSLERGRIGRSALVIGPADSPDTGLRIIE